MVVSDIPLERRGGFVLAAFCFNGYNLRPILQNKINLATLVRVVPRLNLKLPSKLLQDIVLRQRSFELVIGFQKDRTIVNACHVLKKPGIKKEEFELIQFVKC